MRKKPKFLCSVHLPQKERHQGALMPLLFSDTLRKGSTILCPCELDVLCLYKSFMKCPLKLFHAKHCHAAVWHPRLMESFLNIQKQKQLVLGRAMGQKREIHSVPPIICGGALPRLPAPTLAEGQSLSCSSDWEDAAGLGKPIARCTSPQLCACFATLQAGKWWKLVVVFCSYCGKHSRILCPDAPLKSPFHFSSIRHAKKRYAFFMILTVVDAGVVFIICKEHPHGHAHAQLCCSGWRGPCPAAEALWRWQGHGRHCTTPQDTQQTLL